MLTTQESQQNRTKTKEPFIREEKSRSTDFISRFRGRRSLDELALSNLTVLLTDQCNFECAYCYQTRGKQFLDFSTLIKAVDALSPFFSSACAIHFYGGEPLLAFDLIERAVDYFEAFSSRRKVHIRYSLTTNGSLLDDHVLGFLEGHQFSLILSFDGLAQDIQRKKGSYEFLTSIIPRILSRPGISLETNSVFSPVTIEFLSESVRSIIQLGVRKLDVNFAEKPTWTPASLDCLEEELARVGDYFLSRFENPADIPWPGFYNELPRAVFCCPAGLNQMAVSALGTLWGCALFSDYFAGKEASADSEKYGFGGVDSFIRDPRRIYGQKIVNYSALRASRFSTPHRSCLFCGEIEQCRICPIAAALTTGEIGRIPAADCQRAQILRKAKRVIMERFRKKLQNVEAKSSD